MALSRVYALTSLLAFMAAEASAASGNSSSTARNVAACCSKLAQQYPDQVVYANSTSYLAWNERWADTAELAPTCIFRPASAEDVSFAVQTFSVGAGRCHDYCPFSIKGGGHTSWAGASNIDDGIAVILDDLNEVVISDDRTYVSLGGGALWHDAYVKTNGSGVAFPGGRCPGTGVGGVTLGGGYSWFTGELGFVSDSMVNFEIVLSSGDIVNANAEENKDLFLALHGGNNNFGVVTRFDMGVIQHSQQVYGGLAIVPASSSDQVLKELHSFTDDSTGNVHGSQAVQAEYFLPTDGSEGQILLWLIDTQANGTHEAIQPFFDMEPKILNLVHQTAIADYPSSIPPVERVLMSDATFVNDFETLQGVYNITMDIFAEVSHIPGLTWDFQFEPLSRHIQKASKDRGGNILGVADAEKDLMIVFIMPLWSDAKYDDEVHAASEKWYRSIKQYTQSIGKDHPFEFANYAAWYQDPMASYGAENLEFLRTVSRKYDPSSLFQKAVKGGYKLW
ncbi:hypothetical protein ACHAQA_002430 [Verticillium albo-atrum]